MGGAPGRAHTACEETRGGTRGVRGLQGRHTGWGENKGGTRGVGAGGTRGVRGGNGQHTRHARGGGGGAGAVYGARAGRGARGRAGGALRWHTRRARRGRGGSHQCASSSPLRWRQQLGAETPLWGPGPIGPVIVSWHPSNGWAISSSRDTGSAKSSSEDSGTVPAPCDRWGSPGTGNGVQAWLSGPRAESRRSSQHTCKWTGRASGARVFPGSRGTQCQERLPDTTPRAEGGCICAVRTCTARAAACHPQGL